MREEVQRLASQYGFFHWHLAFPDVFRVPGRDEESDNAITGWSGGFDVVLSNPPWEHTEIKEKEWFAERHPDIANARNDAARARLIANLREEDPALHRAFHEDLRQADGISHFVRKSGRYPLCGRGRINTYSLFAETTRLLIGPAGRIGCILPSGIATDDTTKEFFQDLVQTRSLSKLYGFENEELLFPAVHHFTKFCLLTLSGGMRPQGATDLVFYARQTTDLEDKDRHFQLTSEDLALLNPNTRTCPAFRRRRDADLNKSVYGRVPILVADGGSTGNSWGVVFKQGLFNMATDSGLFRTAEQLKASGWKLEGNVFRNANNSYLPLYEAKMLHQFDHRFSTFEGQTDAQANMNKLPELDGPQHEDADCLVLSRYWIPANEVAERLAGKWERRWLLGWRDITNATNERTIIAAMMPRVGAGHTFPLIMAQTAPARGVACLWANLTAFIADYAARQKMSGTHLAFAYIKQLPVLPPDSYDRPAEWYSTSPLIGWLAPRVFSLSPAIAATMVPRSAGMPPVVSSYDANSMPRSSTCTASAGTMSVTSWTRFRW